MIQAFIILILIGLIFLAVSVALALVRDPDLHVWPGVTRCRICEKRVFVWQRRDFRPYVVSFDDPEDLLQDYPNKISASGIVHRKCKGAPTVTLSVRRRSAG